MQGTKYSVCVKAKILGKRDLKTLIFFQTHRNNRQVLARTIHSHIKSLPWRFITKKNRYFHFKSNKNDLDVLFFHSSFFYLNF